MSKKIECKDIKPHDRELYPEWFSKTELKKLKLMPKPNVKPVACVKRNSYPSYYLYPINKTTAFSYKKKEIAERRKKDKERRIKYTCVCCMKKLSKDDLYIDTEHEVSYNICDSCYQQTYKSYSENYFKDFDYSKTICLDVETTGLDWSKDEILQITILDGEGNVLLNEYCKPENMTEWIQSECIHGITPKKVRNCRPFSDYKDRIQAIFDQAEKIVGYNIDFDLNFIGCDYQGKQIIDIMKQFAYVYGVWVQRYRSYSCQKLSDCAAYYGYNFHAHNSLEDSKATLYCYPRVLCDYDFDLTKIFKNTIRWKYSL